MKNIIKFYEKGSVEIVYGQSVHCFPLHSHKSFCIGVITKGSALYTIDNNKCLLEESMLFILPTNTGISITPSSEYSYITICFKNELKDQLKNIKFSKYFLKLKSTEEILSLCHTFEQTNDENWFLNSILKSINSAIEPYYINQKKQPNETVLSICNYIDKNAAEKFDLDELAKSFYLSKYHLIRMFKTYMGVTPNQYHIQAKIRIIRSKVFQVQSETNLAMKLNLFDQSHLCKLFKKQMGISIKNYRKNLIRK